MKYEFCKICFLKLDLFVSVAKRFFIILCKLSRIEQDMDTEESFVNSICESRVYNEVKACSEVKIESRSFIEVKSSF